MPTTTTDKTTAAVKPLPHKTYTIKGQKRVLFTRGRGHDCKLIDVPAGLLQIAATGAETPDTYVVESGLRPRADNEQLTALITDYVEQAGRHQAVPMTVFASTVSIDAYAAA